MGEYRSTCLDIWPFHRDGHEIRQAYNEGGGANSASAGRYSRRVVDGCDMKIHGIKNPYLYDNAIWIVNLS